MLQRDRETREALDEIDVQALEVETQKAAMEQVCWSGRWGGGGTPIALRSPPTVSEVSYQTINPGMCQ